MTISPGESWFPPQNRIPVEGPEDDKDRTKNPKAPESEAVSRFHDNDDVDGSKFAHHHTLGALPNQAAAGNHKHDGGDSFALFSGFYDYYNTNIENPWERGVAIADGLKNNKKYPESISSVADNSMYGPSDAVRVIHGYNYLVMVEFEVRADVDTYLPVNLKVRTNYMPIPPEGTLYAPPPLVISDPTTSDPSVDHTSNIDVKGTAGGFRQGQFSRIFKAEGTGVAKFSTWFRYGANASLDIRKYNIRVINIGKEEPDMYNTPWQMMYRLMKVLREMGADQYILGGWDTYHL